MTLQDKEKCAIKVLMVFKHFGPKENQWLDFSNFLHTSMLTPDELPEGLEFAFAVGWITDGPLHMSCQLTDLGLSRILGY